MYYVPGCNCLDAMCSLVFMKGEKVRSLKASNTDKVIIDDHVQILTALKSQLPAVTGEVQANLKKPVKK